MLHDEEFKKLEILDLKDSMYWLQVVFTHRIGRPIIGNIWDVIVGKVADAAAQRLIDNLCIKFSTLDFYSIPDDEKIKLLKDLKVYNLIDQYCFRTKSAIDLLNSREYQRKEICNGRIIG